MKTKKYKLTTILLSLSAITIGSIGLLTSCSSQIINDSNTNNNKDPVKDNNVNNNDKDDNFDNNQDSNNNNQNQNNNGNNNQNNDNNQNNQQEKYEWKIEKDHPNSIAHSNNKFIEVKSKYSNVEYYEFVDIDEDKKRWEHFENQLYKLFYNVDYQQKFFNFTRETDYLTTLTDGYYPFKNIKEGFDYFGLTVDTNKDGQANCNFIPNENDGYMYLYLSTTLKIEHTGDYVFNLEIDENGIYYQNHKNSGFNYLIKVKVNKVL